MAYTTINKPVDYFNTITYTGDGVTPKTITGVGFQPEWVWVKRRNDAAGHNLYDVVRGAGSDKNLQSNSTGAEGSGSPNLYGYINAFASDGYTTTAGTTDNTSFNKNNDTYVAWNWLAGGSASSNTDGSITSSVSANTTSGFSIVSYTGNGSADATVGHGLGVTPAMIIIKNRGNTTNWDLWINTFGSGEGIILNLTSAKATDSTKFPTLPTSSVFYPGTNNGTNQNTYSMIAYCFAEKKGFSKFGSYTGNGSSDGTFVYTGFKPALVMTKCSSTTGNWKTSWSVDHLNGTGRNLAPNLSAAENTANKIDILSNGFKCRATDTDRNGSGRTYIYMALAQNPLVTSGGTPATAR